MGTCSTKTKKWNPIANYFSLYSIEQLTRQWEYEEYQILKQKFQALKTAEISQEQLTNQLPRFNEYSKQTRHRFYKLFDLKGNGKVSKIEVIKGLTAIRAVDSPQLISKIMYFVYMENTNEKNEKQIRLSPKGYEKFAQENKNKLITEDQIKKNLVKKKQNKQVDTSKQITLQEFEDIFQQYQYDLFIQIFEKKRDAVNEQKFIEQLLKTQSFTHYKGDYVYLLQFSWFYNWKYYVDNKYNIEIKYKPDSDKKGEETRSMMTFVKKMKKSSQKPRSFIQEENLNNGSYKYYGRKPNRIKNSVLLDDENYNQLKQNLKEYTNYVLVTKQMWLRLRDIYGGAPIIRRMYPQIHTIKVHLVKVDQVGKFVPNKKITFSCIYRSSTLEYFSRKQSYPKSKTLFYRYPGQQNWIEIKNLKTTVGQIISYSSNIYLCFVLSNITDVFKKYYNYQTKDGQKYIEKRIKNYSSLINIPADGAILKGVVIEVRFDEVVVRYKNETTHKIKSFKQDKLKPLNPNYLNKEKKINFLAGMNNFSNNCYMNSVIQCLIRTPAIGKYLSSIVLRQPNKKQNKIQITNELKNMWQDSKSKEMIDIQKFKKVIGKHFQAFQGDSHQDAQQFLISLLDTLSKEGKQVEKYQAQLGFRKSAASDLNNSKQMTKFFTGVSFGRTECEKCKNDNEVTSPFFTYTLSLPQRTQFQLIYYKIPRQKKDGWQIQKCGMTLNKKATINQFISMICEEHKMPKSNFEFYCISMGQLYLKLTDQPQHQKISKLLSFGYIIAVYQINPKQSPVSIELRSRYESSTDKKFQTISYPILIQISNDTYWKDIENQIQRMFIGKFSEMVSGQLDKSAAQKSSKSGRKKSTKDLSSKMGEKFYQNPYRIRIISKETLKCFICKKKIPFDKHTNFGVSFCKGCQMSNLKPLLSVYDFDTLANLIVIMIEWNDEQMFKGIPVKVHKSFEQARKDSTLRDDKLENIFQENFEKKQLLELKCSKDDCNSNRAIRFEGIKQYPNILLVHLSRFRYKESGLVKMQNNVVYSETLTLQNIKYDLYGSVIHKGTCNRGHYFSYVKYENHWFFCDDERVTRAQYSQITDPAAYILFYKRRDFEPGHAYISL